MTDPTGRSFLSYKRARLAEAKLLLAAQHDRGIPTWQDVKDLASAPTNDTLRQVIADPSTANGILWLTPEVADSDVIRQIEIVEIMRRAMRGDGFFALPVSAGGLSYAQAAQVADAGLTLDRLNDWNMTKVHGDPITAAEAAQIADRVLDHRVQAIHRHLPAGSPLRMSFFTRAAAPFQLGTALALDWSNRFNERLAEPATWTEHLLPALGSVTRAVRQYGGGRVVDASGLPSIPAATALGAAFLAQAGLPIQWRQVTPGRADQIWSLSAEREASGFTVVARDRTAIARDVAIMVCVAEDAEIAVAQSSACPQAWRGTVRIANPQHRRFTITSPGQATDIALTVMNGLREARDRFGIFDTVHLFMAVPVGLAMLIGQLLNTFNEIQLYEHIPDGAAGSYVPAVRLRPSGGRV